uniref:RNA helicase n=1 Tax=Trypanosoma congolense (strain IL3000) TaxID=1068625 RepID=G0UX98_TRYCI|nr:putative pre-mRNA splicing factor ATP-dependent RNA helicase [Trypanosoma congolense IL3000]
MSDAQRNTIHLPVTEARREIIRLIQQHVAVVIIGETGSGKTTQIPQFVWDDIVSKKNSGIVGCTQPRRVAAVSVARHVAQQRGCPVGGEVAYAVRFDDTCTKKTKIKFMTDGILLREIQADPKLSNYGCLILDEAHERTLHGDVLFGLLKEIVRRRKRSLSIVIMSATLNEEHFSKFWWNAPVGVVHGRTFPVTIYHTMEPQVDYVEAAVSALLQIHEKEEPGDILCFLTGREEIEDAKRMLESRMKLLANNIGDFVVLTLYSAMPYEQQLLVFDPVPDSKRKIILATNIAETSITVEGIKYVVDSGVVKAKHYNSKVGMEVLVEVDVSKAQAMQRAGRAGRTAAGKCFRLYTARAFESLRENTVPEIQRSSLVSVVLQMKSLNIDSIANFDFMDSPNPQALVKAEETLVLLDALDSKGRITPLGMRLTDFPIDATAAIVLLAGKALGVMREAVIAIAMTSTENLFLSSPSMKERADRCKASYSKAAGDHATLVSIYHAFKHLLKDQRALWCESNGISYRQMLKVEDVITQLMAILTEGEDNKLVPSLVSEAVCASLPLNSLNGKRNSLNNNASADVYYSNDCNGTTDIVGDGGSNVKKPRDFELLRRALCCGYFLNVAFFNAKIGVYQTVIGQQVVHIHPSSVLFTLRKKPALVLFSSVVRTTRSYMKDVSIVYEAWLRDTKSFLRITG